MIKKDNPRVYSQYEISVITFLVSMIFFLPIVLVFTYLFEIDNILNINTFMLWVLIANVIILVIGSVYLAFNRDRLRRKVKATYRGEYFYILFICAFSLLGFIVIYDYMGGNRAYIANIIVVVFFVMVYLLIYLGRRFFKIDFIRKN